MTEPLKIEGDPNAKYDLPAELVTPEKLEAAALTQKELARRIQSPFAHKSPQDITRFNASITVKETEAMLAVVPVEHLGDVTRNIYAEALAELGHFDKAAEATTSEPHRAYYSSVVDALNMDDAEQCTCERPKYGQHVVNHLFVETEVYSHVHGKRMPIIKCSQCGHRNARPLPASIAAERDQRAKVRSYTSGKTKEDGLVSMQQAGIPSKFH